MGSLLLDGVGEPDDLRGQAPLAGLQDPAVGVGEAGEVEGQQFVEGALGLVEASLKLAGRRAEGRDGRRAGRGHRAARITQQRLTGSGIVGRDPPGREKGLGLARGQAVARESVGQARLLRPRQGGEGVRGAPLKGAAHGFREEPRHTVDAVTNNPRTWPWSARPPRGALQ